MMKFKFLNKHIKKPSYLLIFWFILIICAAFLSVIVIKKNTRIDRTFEEQSEIVASSLISEKTGGELARNEGRNKLNHYFIYYSTDYSKELINDLERQNKVASKMLSDKKSLVISYIEEKEINSKISKRYLSTVEYMWHEEEKEFNKVGTVRSPSNIYFSSSEKIIQLKDIVQNEENLMGVHRILQEKILSEHSYPEKVLSTVLDMSPITFKSNVRIHSDSLQVLVNSEDFGFHSVSIPYEEIYPFIDTKLLGVKNASALDVPRKRVALTFDDGPSIYTRKLLEELEQEQVVATFFVLGEKVVSNPEIVKEMIAKGHEIGNHTYSHPDLVTQSFDSIRKEITQADKQIYLATGRLPKTFRAPYGSIDKRVSDAVRLPIIQWDIDSQDWLTKDSKLIFDSIKGKVKDGSIILLHDIHKETVDAVPDIIQYLKNNDFELTTITELLSNRQKPNNQYFKLDEVSRFK